MIICDNTVCTGCSSCYNSCAHDAITMETDRLGFLHPSINDNRCVECGICIQVCPVNHKVSVQYPLASFVAAAADRREIATSTSGGMASVFAREIIREGGLVYGCAEDSCEEISHTRIEKEVDVARLKGSKYVQSTIGKSFSLIKKDLKLGRKVLFIGTPCQVAGLRSFLRKDYDSLITIDLVCHGVPSIQILKDAIKSYLPSVDISKCKAFFRERNSKGKSKYGLFVKDENGRQIYEGRFPKNEYIVGFLTALFYRESCYHCQFARRERVSDITLGDYWDKEGIIKIGIKGVGLSMLIVNTIKGKLLTESIKNRVLSISGNYEVFVRRNAQLEHPMPKHPLHDQFASFYAEMGFLPAAQVCLKKDINNIKRNQIIDCLADILFMIPGIQPLFRFIKKRTKK